MSNLRREPARALGIGPTGANLCFCGCAREVQKPRRNWFSEDCIHNWKVRNDPQYVRSLVFRRDGGICAICADNTEAIRAATITAELRTHDPGWVARYRKSRWQADHIIPVVRGGGQCGLENYRTLCIPCHKTVTAKLARERANEKKTQ